MAERAPGPSGPDGTEPWASRTRDSFVELLGTGHDAISVIESLDHVGIWERFLPEWDAVRNKPQRNVYHRFTVDRHLLETCANAAALVSSVDRPDLLLLGALLHDIGKGRRGDHTEVGMDLVVEIAPRLGYDPADTAVLVDLVRHHLLLPDVATRRDITDEATISAVAEAVGDRTRLGLLAALTEADSLATGPAAWGAWKAELVRELVRRTDHYLAGGDLAALATREFPDARQRELLGAGRVEVNGRNDVLDPTAGTFASVDLSGSGAFVGSDFEYARLFGQLNLYRKVATWNGRSIVWAQSTRLGLARAFGGQELLRDVRFFAGGEYSVRAYETESLGPEEVLGSFRRPAGGEALVVINEELRFPLFADISGLVFFDLGQIWADASDVDTDLAKSLGLGLRARTPIGLLRGDVAFPLDRREGDPGYRFYVGLGNAF
jgi:hypothetical protein